MHIGVILSILIIFYIKIYSIFVVDSWTFTGGIGSVNTNALVFIVFIISKDSFEVMLISLILC